MENGMKQNEQKWRLNKGKWWNISRRSILFKCHFVSIEFGRNNIHYTSSAFRRKILLYYDKSGQSLHVSRNISVPKSSSFIWTYKIQKTKQSYWMKEGEEPLDKNINEICFVYSKNSQQSSHITNFIQRHKHMVWMFVSFVILSVTFFC